MYACAECQVRATDQGADHTAEGGFAKNIARAPASCTSAIRRLHRRGAKAWAPLSRRHFSAVTRGSRKRSLHVEPEGDCRR